MPIEFCFVDNSDQEAQEWDHYLVERGEGILIGPYDAEEQDIIFAITCNRKDDGGMIQVMPAVGALQSQEFSGTTTDRLSLPEAIAKIAITQTRQHEHPISDNNNNGYLKIRHVPGNQITPGFQIPKGLAHPN